MIRANLRWLALTVPVILGAQGRGGFPHERHAPLFSSCLECHAGIPTGDAAHAFPAPADCAVCHDEPGGQRAGWTRKAPGGAGLLAFSHPAHAKRAGKDATCESCHAAGPGAMNVARATPEKCLTCHAHQATAHKAEGNTCATCHRKGSVRMHEANFTRVHSAAASTETPACAGCHASRFCTDCHAGERVSRRYHVANFASSHASKAFGSESGCTSCHSTTAFCRDCHRQSGLTARAGSRTTRYHNAQPQWLFQHGRAARQDLATCTTCHQQTYCLQCHSSLGLRINPHGPGFDAPRLASRNSRMCLICHFTNPLGK